eukprot:1702611-Prymnesium_polylepis.1
MALPKPTSSATACQQRARPVGLCGPTELFDRSYDMPRRWPYAPVFLVMERTPTTCDLYAHGARYFCCEFSRGRTHEPERHVTEVITSFLTGCLAAGRVCNTVDLG